MKTCVSARASVSLFLATTALSWPNAPSYAAGAFGGQDLYHVPVAWCAIQGSPAASNPNITPVGSAVADTSTDAVLWRRHERPTDNIYVNVAGITFRSTILNSWGTLNFPVLADPDVTLGVQGDMRGENVNTAGVEFNQMINNCDAAYASPAYGMAGIGITAVNANLFHDAAGNYVGVIGWGGCTQSTVTNDCTGAYDGRVVLIDNNYLYPTVADRTFPPSPADAGGNLQFTVTDPLDQLAGHEFGHALSLPHRTNATALMNPSTTDNDGDGQADNIGLNATEIADVRTNVQSVPGLEIDPPLRIDPGAFVAMRHVDKIGDADGPDIASVKVALNTQTGEAEFNAQFSGLLPAKLEVPLRVAFALDTDENPQTALPADIMSKEGLPDGMWAGADALLVADYRQVGDGPDFRVALRGWTIVNGDPVAIRDDRFGWDFRRLIMHPHYADIRGRRPEIRLDAVPVYDVAVIRIPAKTIGVTLDRPFGVKVLARLGEGPGDVFGVEEPRRFVMQRPAFAHCFALEEGKPGGTVDVRIEGLLPNRSIHGLVGPVETFRGQTDAAGGGVIALPIPADAREGLHLVTIGIEETALTADCVVDVTDGRAGGPGGIVNIDDPRVMSLLKSHEELLHGHERLVEQAGDIVREVLVTRRLSDAEAMRLVADYRKLLGEHTALVARFEKLVAAAVGSAE